MIGQSPRYLPDNTQYSPETDVSAIGGIRNGNPISKQAAADSGLRPQGRWDWLVEEGYHMEFVDA